MFRKILTGSLFILVLGSCTATPSLQNTPETTIRPTLKLYVFDCGKLKYDSIESFSVSDTETNIREMSVPCYMVEHGKARLLWEGGLPPSVAAKAGWQSNNVLPGLYIRQDRTLKSQLAGMGLNMRSFDYVVFSHMHFDHIGAANDVEGSKVIIQKTEYDAAFAKNITPPGMNPALYKNLKNARTVIIDGDYDIFGDGSVRIISGPGHTSGHQLLFVNLKNTGPIILTGDLYHFAISRKGQRVPKSTQDAKQLLATMNRIENLAKETRAKVWIEHELALFERLKLAPAYYD